jgi:hypothetical protein
MTMRQLNLALTTANERLRVMYGGKGGRGQSGHPMA